MKAPDPHELSIHLRELSELQAQLDTFIGSFSTWDDKSPYNNNKSKKTRSSVDDPTPSRKDKQSLLVLPFPSPHYSPTVTTSGNASSNSSIQEEMQRPYKDIIQDFAEIEQDVIELSREIAFGNTRDKHSSYRNPLPCSYGRGSRGNRSTTIINDNRDRNDKLPRAVPPLLCSDKVPSQAHFKEIIQHRRPDGLKEMEVKKLKRTVRVLEDMVLDGAAPQAVVEQVLELQNRNKQLEKELVQANAQLSKSRVLNHSGRKSSSNQSFVQNDEFRNKVSILEAENKKLKRLKSFQRCSRSGETPQAKEIIRTKSSSPESGNGSDNLSNGIQGCDGLTQWRDAKRSSRRLVTLKQKLDSTTTELDAANERIRRLEELINKLRSDNIKKDGVVLELRRKVQTLESQEGSGQQGFSEKLQMSLLQHLRSLQKQYDELKENKTSQLVPHNVSDALKGGETEPDGENLLGQQSNYEDLDIDPTTQLQLERDQATSWASRLEKIIEDATRRSTAQKLSRSDRLESHSLREHKLLNTISILKGALSKHKSEVQNGVPSSKYMKAIEKSKAAAVRIVELEREVEELTEMRHRYSSAQQEVVHSQSILSSLRSQIQQLKKQLKEKDETMNEIWSGKVKELERALLERDAHIVSLEHPAIEEARILLDEGITPKLLVEHLIRCRAELAVRKPEKETVGESPPS